MRYNRLLLPVLVLVTPGALTAGQGTIRETDTEIIIEYSGGADEVKEVEKRKADEAVQEKASDDALQRREQIERERAEREADEKRHAAQREKSKARRSRDAAIIPTQVKESPPEE